MDDLLGFLVVLALASLVGFVIVTALHIIVIVAALVILYLLPFVIWGIVRGIKEHRDESRGV